MLFCSGQDEPEPLLLTGGTALSPQAILEFGRQLAGQVETRLQTGWFFLLSSFFLLVAILCCIWRFTQWLLVYVLGLDDFAEKMGDRLSKRPKEKKYSSRNYLHRRMLNLHPAFPDFFFCRVCRRDVGMKAHGSGEFARHFQSDSHWFKDVTYRVHMKLPVLNRLMEPMELSASQLAEYQSRPFEDLSEGYPFPEELLPKHSRVGSKVRFMTLVGCLCELLRSGGDFLLLRRLWRHFLASLSEEQGPQFALNWSRSETVVSILCRVLFLF